MPPVADEGQDDGDDYDAGLDREEGWQELEWLERLAVGDVNNQNAPADFEVLKMAGFLLELFAANSDNITNLSDLDMT